MTRQDFFTYNWKEFFSSLRDEILVLGNPPWVTNAALGALEATIFLRKQTSKSRWLCRQDGQGQLRYFRMDVDQTPRSPRWPAR